MLKNRKGYLLASCCVQVYSQGANFRMRLVGDSDSSLRDNCTCNDSWNTNYPYNDVRAIVNLKFKQVIFNITVQQDGT